MPRPCSQANGCGHLQNLNSPILCQAFKSSLGCTLIQHTTSHALLTSPTPHQGELICGACIGTPHVATSLAAPTVVDSLFKRSNLRSCLDITHVKWYICLSLFQRFLSPARPCLSVIRWSVFLNILFCNLYFGVLAVHRIWKRKHLALIQNNSSKMFQHQRSRTRSLRPPFAGFHATVQSRFTMNNCKYIETHSHPDDVKDVY